MVNEFYLCQESMHKLGIISHNFPSIGDALTQHTCLETNEASVTTSSTQICSCPPRKPVPSRPHVLPFNCSVDNIEKMRDWLLEKFACSTFNTCPHQPLPCMRGPPVEIHLDQKAIPRVCHTPANVPLHWQDKVKSDLERDEALGVIEKVPYVKSQ